MLLTYRLCGKIHKDGSDTMTFALHTFGCKVNIYESEYITNILEESGYKMIDFNHDKEADIYIINTCTVTNEADKKDRKLIHATRKNRPNSILIVMGCYSQLNPNDIDADIILGNKYKSKIIDLIDEYKSLIEDFKSDKIKLSGKEFLNLEKKLLFGINIK